MSRRPSKTAQPASAAPDGGPRLTANMRKGGRAARVVEAVLRATLELLGEVGYDGLRVEDVAERSGVNKTTVYRRWPSRVELVEAALESLGDAPRPALTGDVRDDMVNDIAAGMRWLGSPAGRGLAHVLMKADPDHALRPIVLRLRERALDQRVALLDGAVIRGELPAGSDTRLVAETLQAAIYSRVIRFGEAPTTRLIEGIVDLVLAGAKAGGARPRDRSRPRQETGMAVRGVSRR